MSRRATVSLICGFIGADKTTFARQLERRTGAVRITKDEWSIRLIGSDPTIPGYADWDRRIVDLSRDVAFGLAARGIDVILDEGFWARAERDALRRRAADVGADAVVYYLATPIATIRERVAARNANLSGDAFAIGPELLEGYLALWQPPGADEEVILVRTGPEDAGS